MRDLQRVGFLGHLDSDTDPLYLKEGNYTDALNVRSITDSTESSHSKVNILGNEFAVSIGTTDVQNKIYSVAINSVALTTNQLTFKDQNGNVIATTANFNIAANANVTTSYNATVLPAITTAFNTAIPTIQGNISLQTTGNQYGEVIIELTGAGGTPFTGRDYTIESTGTNKLVCTVIEESYDAFIAGDMQVIGSYDLQGELFVFSTSQTELPSTISATIATISNSTPATVTTNTNHGLSQNQLIKIAGSSANNGRYIVSAITGPTTFRLGGTGGLPSSTGGTIEIDIQGVGEIGVVRYDPNLPSSNWTYTRLVKSKDLNFVTKKQIDCYVEKNADLISIYWVDDYNKPRVLYYTGDYVQDGAIIYYNTKGKYTYETIDVETRLQQSQLSTVLAFLGQDQAGGTIKSGNWRYTYRFVGESGESTEWSDLSNPVPVFLSSTNASANAISGDNADVTTGKVNNFSVSGILPNLFKYIEFAGVNYLSSNSQVGYIIRKELLGSLTSINLSHTGNESYTTLDLGTLNVRPIIYETAKNITAIDNRLVLSNLTVKAQQDFSAWTQTWKHSLFKKEIQGVGLVLDSLRVGEYNDPDNVYNYVGYMNNETYRYSAKFRLKDGSLTNNFWIDDILFDISASNITTPNRRIIGLPNYNLTDDSSDMSVTYSTYVQFSNIDFNYIIDGKPARDLVSEIIIERVECVKEILFTGMAAMSTFDGSTNTIAGSLTPARTLFYNNFTGASTVQYIGEYPFVESRVPNDAVGTVLYSDISTQQRTAFSFYSPDILYGQGGLNYINTDEILNYGSPNLKSSSVPTTTQTYKSVIADYNGYTNSSIQKVKVNLVSNLSSGQVSPGLFGSSIGYSKLLLNYTTNTPGGSGETIDFNWAYMGTPVIGVVANLTNGSVNPDYGFYYVQYKRPATYTATNPDSSKYGNRTLSKYIPTGASLIVNSSTTATTIDVFGGDTFTQKSYVKRRFATTSSYGMGGGTCFYSQNRVNSQLNKKYSDSFSTWLYPNKDTTAWLELNSTEINAPVQYNKGYNSVNNISSDVAFDSSNNEATNYPVRIIYSDIKLQNGLVDGYRSFLPLNFKDLDLSFGEIVHTANGNGELITWQPRKLQRQYFNTTGILQTSSNLNVLIGDGSVLSRDGQTLSVIGSKHKWAIIHGKSPQGNDTFYWINTELKKAIRFGYDGTISLADIRGMQSFLANNLTWIDDKDNPADGQGICGVWDDRFMEAIFTVRGKRTVTAWSSTANYNAGQTVSYTPATTFSTYEKTGEIYTALQGSGPATVGAKNPETQTTYWQLIPHTNNQYYNEYSLAYNELRNGFTTFYSFLPKIYLKWKDSFLTPQPIPNRNRLYIHNKGSYCIFYSGGASSQQVDGFIEGVVNKDINYIKWYEALMLNGEVSPHRFDFTTQTQKSFLTASEITAREGNYFAPIKRDSTSNGINDGDTSALYGKWMKVKLTFQTGVYQKLTDLIVKFRNSVRLPNR